MQRAFVVGWAIKEHERTGGFGLEPGCGQAVSPFCVSSDYYAGYDHPEYGGTYKPNVRCLGEVLPFKNEAFDFIVSHHSLEHMRNTRSTLLEWLRVIKPGGKIAIVMPDKKYGPFGDPSHVSECTPEEFGIILNHIPGIRVIEIDTFKNNMSFNALIEKEEKNIKGEIMSSRTKSELDFRFIMECLWKDRTYLLVECLHHIADGSEDSKQILNTLRTNQDDIGSAIGKYFIYACPKQEQPNDQYCTDLLNKSHPKNNTKLTEDEEKWLAFYQAGNMLTTMLKNNVTISKNLFISRKENNVDQELNTEEALNENAISIAAFLNNINPNWSHEYFKKILFDYNRFLIGHTIATLEDNKKSETEYILKLQCHAKLIADAIVDGVVKMFPEEFKNKDTGS